MSELKDTNPKDEIAMEKIPLHLWPMSATVLGSLGLMEGAAKYGRLNWRKSGVRASVYVSALYRHISKWFEGEDSDSDSGLPHLAHALACIAILVDAQVAGKLTDDRQYNGEGYRKFVTDMTPHVKKIRQLHATKQPKHYSIVDDPSAK